MSVISATQGIRDEIAARLNEVESDSTDIYTNWINLGVRDIALSFPNAPFLQTSADRTLSAGTRVYPALISNIERINQVVDPTNNIKLQFVSPEEFDILAPSATQGGNSTIYTIRGLAATGWFEFYPTPASNITLHFDYEKQIDTVSASSSTPGIPAKYFELLVLYGEKTGLRRQKRYDLAKQVDQDYQVMKQRMMEDLIRQTSQMPRIMNVREFRAGNQITSDPIAQQFFGQGNNF